MDRDLDTLVRHLDEEVVRGGFKRVEPVPAAPEIEIAAVWKQKVELHVWAVAVVSLGRFTNHPGDFAHCVKRRVARAIGYFPVFGRVTLYPVIFGRGILARSDELHGYMERRVARVTLPSIHVVDLDASAALAHFQEVEGEHAEVIEPSHDSVGMMPGLLFKLFLAASAALRAAPVRACLAYSRRTGRAMRSVCFRGGRTDCIDLLDRGAEAFVRGHEQEGRRVSHDRGADTTTGESAL
jgi:hypothetical protein